MAKRRPSFLADVSVDPQKRATAMLDAAIDAPETDEQVVPLDERLKAQQAERQKQKQPVEAEQKEERVGVEEVLRGGQVLVDESRRDQIRLLILTRDTSVTTGGSVAQKRILELSEMFAELHIIVLSQTSDGLSAISRMTENVWVYPTNSKHWWKTPLDARRIANEQLNFVQGFRADLVLAEDPFESGLAGYFIASRYDRPYEVHVFEDLYNPEFSIKAQHNNLRLFAARFCLSRADCVRTKSEYVKDAILERFKDLEGHIEMLPIYYNLALWRDAKPSFDLKERYPQFKFIMLHVSHMSDASHTDRIITGSARALTQYPTIGLVIVGSGPLRRKLEKQAITLGLSKQVIFEPLSNDLTSHMKTADILLHISEDPEEEFVVLQAAACGLPMVVGIAGLAGELFLDGESAFICQNDSPPCVSAKVRRFLNENHLRVKFEQNAREVVFRSVEQNYETYLRAYRDSIERCMLIGTEDE